MPSPAVGPAFCRLFMTDTRWGCKQERPQKVQINFEQFLKIKMLPAKKIKKITFYTKLNIQNPNKEIIMEGIEQQFVNLLDNCRV